MEVEAIKFSDTYTTYTDFYDAIISSISTYGYLPLIGVSSVDDFKSKYSKSLNYISTIIYNYYLSYYLTASSKESFERLSCMTLLGKLPKWETLLSYYFEVITKDVETTHGTTNTTTRNGKFERDGTSAQATTPQDFQTSNDYINDYTSSQQKYSNNGTEDVSGSFKSNNIGSLSDTFKHIEDIPSKIYEEVVGSFAKYFYYGDFDLTPDVCFTFEVAIDDLKKKLDKIVFTDFIINIT